MLDTVMTPLRAQLLDILKQKGLRRLPEPIELASGELSSDFVDGKEALAQWSDLKVAGDAIVETLRANGIEFDAVGGLTLGADALAVAIAAASDSRWFIVRKEPKKRGTRRLIEGAQITTGDRVVVVDDAVTSGGSILQALDVAIEAGATPVAAVTLVDRGDIAAPKFAARGVPYFPMITYRDLEIVPVRGG
jgi:orotate phosphoribosyltransferase